MTRIRRILLPSHTHTWLARCSCGWWGSTPTGPEIAALVTDHRAIAHKTKGTL